MIAKTLQRLPPLVLVTILLLTACARATATPEPTAVPTEPPIQASVELPPADPSEPVVVTPPEVPGECIDAPIPEVQVREADETDWVKGARLEEATMVLYEYSDFQCPACSAMAPVIDSFVDLNPGVALVYRHFPLDYNPYAQIMAEASEAAGAQGKFWEMHDLIFAGLLDWSSLDSEAMVRTLLSAYAEELGLDVAQFDAALEAGTYSAKVERHYDEAREMGLPGTPSLIFGNVLFPSDIGLSFEGLLAFYNILDRQDEIFFPAPPELTISAEDDFTAVLKTAKGDVRIALLPESAPVHVNNFIFLAQEQWYNGSDFFFVRDDFVAVTGDPTNSTVGYPGYYCQGETQGTFDRAGLVGMLSNGQFFLTLGADASQLSGQFALIGQVIEGLEVLDTLTRRVVGDPAAPAADSIQSIDIIQQ